MVGHGESPHILCKHSPGFRHRELADEVFGGVRSLLRPARGVDGRRTVDA
jgi:hypothetical protein